MEGYGESEGERENAGEGEEEGEGGEEKANSRKRKGWCSFRASHTLTHSHTPAISLSLSFSLSLSHTHTHMSSNAHTLHSLCESAHTHTVLTSAVFGIQKTRSAGKREEGKDGEGGRGKRRGEREMDFCVSDRPQKKRKVGTMCVRRRKGSFSLIIPVFSLTIQNHGPETT